MRRARADLSVFYGILIKMHYRDHAPPHFHAEYGEFELIVNINQIAVAEGSAPPRVRSMVLEWAALHQTELAAAWDACRREQAPGKIDPLD